MRGARLWAGLAAANAGAWVWAAVGLRAAPLLLGTALVAYGLGLRHAVDADHIAAIDNVTRKLMGSRQPAATVGLWFSLGHSTVVLLGAAALSATARAAQGRGEGLAGGEVGTAVSAVFLLGIGVINLMALWSGARAGEGPLAGGGWLARLARPLFGAVSRSWQMYPVGVLFGLGFDTASEIGLLGISAAEATRGLGLGTILVFPALFAAGMALVDSADNALMLGAYGGALAQPRRTYNLIVTAISALVALGVGGVEALGLLRGGLRLL
ncbi:MAG TPA: hypothetical protein VMV31_11505 [Terriglobales bacterium]|nr:hypothetical protein [Terriglobales bacterium]